MAKLSTQLQKGRPQQIQTRTLRVRQQQERKRDIKDFERLKAEAEQVQKEKFEGKAVTTEDYKKVYTELKPELKQFFETPEKVIADKNQRISDTKSQVLQKIQEAEAERQKDKERYEKRVDYYEDKYEEYRKRGYDSQYSSEQRKKYLERARKYKERAQDYDDRGDEEDDYHKGVIKGLQKGLKELDANKDIDYKSIYSYARDVGKYEEAREEAKNEQKKEEAKKRQEITDLERKGYTAQVLVGTYKGNPDTVRLAYYNQKTGDFVNIEKYDTSKSGKLDVTGLKKLGYSSPQQRTITYGGREIKFTSKVGIYADKEGRVVTPYGQTGFTEEGLIKEAQDKAFEEYKSTKKYNVPFVKLDPKTDLPVGYGTQGTVSTAPQGVLFDDKQYFEIQDQKKPSVFSRVLAPLKYVDERINWDFSITGTGGVGSMPKVQFVSFGKKETPATKFVEKGETGLSDYASKVDIETIGAGKVDTLSTSLETKYQGEYQASFEDKYMKEIIYGKTSFEQASLEFEGSEEAQLIQKKYAKEYGTGYKELQTDVDFWSKKGLKGGVIQTGIGFGQLGLGLFKTPLRTAGTLVGGTYAYKGLALIPKPIVLGATAGLGVYGGAVALDPTKTYAERGSGLVTAVISGAVLGGSAVKYLKSPVTKVVKIKAPKQTLKATSVVGKDLGKKVIFDAQKVSQTGIGGQRTIVTTKGRLLSNRFFRAIGVNKKFTTIDSNAIYRGIPTQQLGTRAYYERFGGLIKVGKQSGYARASKLLQKYGWTQSQARATLRYTAPRVIEQSLVRGDLTIKGGQASGVFTYATKQPVLTVDKTLGIKTRGARPIYRTEIVTRKLIEESGKKIVETQRIGLSGVGDKTGLKKVSDFDIAVSKGLVKTSDLYEAPLRVNTGKVGVNVQVNVKDLYSTQFTKSISTPNKIIWDASKTKLISKIKTLDKGYKVQTPADIDKTPFPKYDQITPKTSNVVNKIVNKLENKATGGSQSIKITSPAESTSQYYGTGQYEKVDAVLQSQLKGGIFPPQIKEVGLANLIKVTPQTSVGFANIGNVAILTNILKGKTGLKSDFEFKGQLKTDYNLKNLLKEDLALKTDTKSSLDTKTALKSQLKSLLKNDLGVGLTSPQPTFKTPTIKNPTFQPPILIPFLTARKQRGRKGKKSKGVSEFAYLPDFTSRAIGLDPEVLTQEQANIRVKKILTGLEIRRGVRVR